MAVTALGLPSRRIGERRWSPEMLLGTIFVVPYVVVFLGLVVWPVAYGVWLGSSPASYRTLFAELLGEQPVDQADEPIATEPDASGPVEDGAINNSVPTLVTGGPPRRLS